MDVLREPLGQTDVSDAVITYSACAAECFVESVPCNAASGGASFLDADRTGKPAVALEINVNMEFTIF